MEKRERVGGGQQLILHHMVHQAGVEYQCLHSLSQNHVLYKTTHSYFLFTKARSESEIK